MSIWPILERMSRRTRNYKRALGDGPWRLLTTAGNRESVSHESIRGGAVVMAARLMKGDT